MKKKGRILLSCILAIVMLVGILPMAQKVYAASVENLVWNGNSATWDAFPGADSYRVILANMTHGQNNIISTTETATSSPDYSQYLLPGNTYRIEVAPVVSGEVQGWTWTTERTIAGSIGTITNVSVDASTRIAAWDAVAGADGYQVWVLFNGYQTGPVRKVYTNSFDLSEDVAEEGSGNYSVHVITYKPSTGNNLAEGESARVYIGVLTQYTVTFDLDGGSMTGPVSVTVNNGDTVERPSSDPIKENYKFDDWYTDETYSHKFDFYVPIRNNTTVYARFIPKTKYTVTFDTDGGSAIGSQTVYEGDSAERPAVDPVKQNYIFDDWYSDSDFTWEYDFSSPITSNTTVYAKFNIVQHTVTLDLNGGTALTMDTSPFPVDHGQELSFDGIGSTIRGRVQAPTHKEFDAFEANGTRWDNGTYAVVSDVTLRVLWKDTGTYTITFDANGGTGIMAPVTVYADDTYNLPSNDTFDAPYGKEFDYWEVTVGSVTSEVKWHGNDTIGTITANTVVKAIWKDGIVPDGPTITSLTNEDTASGITVTWAEVAGATKYQLQRSVDGGTWVSVTKSATGTSRGDTKASLMGSTYAYKVRAYVSGKWTEYSPAVSVKRNPFTDVAEDANYFNYVAWGFNNKIVNGTSKTTFSPGNTSTRAQFCVLLYKLAGKPAVSGDAPFTDIGGLSGNVRNAVIWAYSEGIIKGMGDGTFNPDGNVTRAQVVIMLYKLAGKPKVSGDVPFTDIDGQTANVQKAILWANKIGIAKGTSSTTFSPTAECTRAQLVIMLYRFNNKVMHYI